MPPKNITTCNGRLTPNIIEKRDIDASRSINPNNLTIIKNTKNIYLINFLSIMFLKSAMNLSE